MEIFPKFSYFANRPLCLLLFTVLGQFVDFYRNWPWSGRIHLKNINRDFCFLRQNSLRFSVLTSSLSQQVHTSHFPGWPS